MLEKKLEEMRKKSWEDPMMVTECVWVRGASQAAAKRSWAACDAALPVPRVVALGLWAQLDPRRDPFKARQLVVLSRQLASHLWIGLAPVRGAVSSSCCAL